MTDEEKHEIEKAKRREYYRKHPEKFNRYSARYNMKSTTNTQGVAKRHIRKEGFTAHDLMVMSGDPLAMTINRIIAGEVTFTM